MTKRYPMGISCTARPLHQLGGVASLERRRGHERDQGVLPGRGR
jgi:hypothetical protein